MKTKSKLIYQALLLVGAPIVTYVVSRVSFASRDVPSDLWVIIYSLIAMVYFAIVLAIDYYRQQKGKPNFVHHWLRGGIYASIIVFILMIAQNIYSALPLGFASPQGTTSAGYVLRNYPADFLPENYLLLILIVLMIVALKVNKSDGLISTGYEKN